VLNNSVIGNAQSETMNAQFQAMFAQFMASYMSGAQSQPARSNFRDEPANMTTSVISDPQSEMMKAQFQAMFANFMASYMSGGQPQPARSNFHDEPAIRTNGDHIKTIQPRVASRHGPVGTLSSPCSDSRVNLKTLESSQQVTQDLALQALSSARADSLSPFLG
jgi:hypothetical protein